MSILIDDAGSVRALVHVATGSVSIVQAAEGWTPPEGFIEAVGEQRHEILDLLYFQTTREPGGPTPEEDAAREAARAGRVDAARALVGLGLTVQQAHYLTGLPVADIDAVPDTDGD